MKFNNNIGFETDLKIEVASKLIFSAFSSFANKVKSVDLKMDKVQLVAWHFEYKQSLMECSLLYVPDFPIRWLLTINTQIPIEFNVGGNYQMDENNVEELSSILSNALQKVSGFDHVKQYSNQELKKMGIG